MAYEEQIRQMVQARMQPYATDLAQKKSAAEAAYFTDPTSLAANYQEVADPVTRLKFVQGAQDMMRQNVGFYQDQWDRLVGDEAGIVDAYVRQRQQEMQEREMASQQAARQIAATQARDTRTADQKDYEYIKQNMGDRVADAWVAAKLGLSYDEYQKIKGGDAGGVTGQSNGAKTGGTNYLPAAVGLGVTGLAARKFIPAAFSAAKTGLGALGAKLGFGGGAAAAAKPVVEVIAPRAATAKAGAAGFITPAVANVAALGALDAYLLSKAYQRGNEYLSGRQEGEPLISREILSQLPGSMYDAYVRPGPKQSLLNIWNDITR